jgi:uncharacterized membrane protein YdbT with pleckstrin-like domain
MSDTLIRPTMKFVRAGYLAVLGVVVAAFAVVLSGAVEGVPTWVPAVLVALFLWPAGCHLRRQVARITITADKLRYESGFLSKTTRTIQLPKVQDVRVDQTLKQRIFGVGDLSIETAGEASRLTMANIDGPQSVADRIIDAARQTGAAQGA